MTDGSINAGTERSAASGPRERREPSKRRARERVGEFEGQRPSSKTKCLSIHAGYRCRHSGACCRAGWTIPFSNDEFETASRLPVMPTWFGRDDTGQVYARERPDGACAFLEDSGLCAIHRLGSVGALPVSCRMFPRVALHDPRGTFVSLSHFCPTAAAMLFAPHGAVTIVDAPDSLVCGGELDGLDARDVWPPLLRPGVLMDVDSYGAWEARAIDLLTRDDRSAAGALVNLRDATARIARWSPGEEALFDVVERVFADAVVASSTSASGDRAIKRWLAARLFANWVAYQRDGLAAIVGYLEACLETFEREVAVDGDALQAIRRSDLIILHRTGSEGPAHRTNK